MSLDCCVTGYWLAINKNICLQRQIFFFIKYHYPVMQHVRDIAISSKEIPLSHIGNDITGS